MIFLSNNTLPEDAIKKMQEYGKTILLPENGAVYKAISNHPDIFCCIKDDSLVIAPQLDENTKRELSEAGINIIEGKTNLGEKYPETAVYNAVVTEKYIIGKLSVIDESIKTPENERILINVNQAYTRCNLLPLPDNRFISSDKGIFNQLMNNNIQVIYVSPKGIILDDFEHGFFGGCCGVFENKIFIAGNLNYYPEGEKIKAYLKNFEIIKLYDGPLLDVGSIFIF